MAKTAGCVVFRCGESEERLWLSHRDIRLLDGEYFLPRPVNYRSYLGLDFIKGLGAPGEGAVLARHKRSLLTGVLKGLSSALADQRDLISHSYQFRFSGKPESSGGGGLAGFRVRGLAGSISVEPAGYCTVVLSDVAPTGRGRIAQIIDMRLLQKLETDDWGTLTLTRRSAEVGWFEGLPRVLAWLDAQQAPDVEVLHGSAS